MTEPTEQPGPGEQPATGDEDLAAARERSRVQAISAGLASFGFTAVITAVTLLASPAWALGVAGVTALWFSYTTSTRVQR